MNLSREHDVILDSEDMPLLTIFKWRIVKSNKTFYANISVTKKLIELFPMFSEKLGQTIGIHNLILGKLTGHGLTIDHINGNGLDNRKENLRVCTNAQNNFNRGKSSKNRSGYKGVTQYPNGKGATAQITHNQKTIYIGTFATAEQAARAYDKKARELFGEFARCNF